MNTLGDIFKAKREKMGLSLDTVSLRLKIRPDFVEKMERSDFDLGISEVYIKGFIRNYSKLLNLDTNKVQALYRREVINKQSKSNIEIQEAKMKTRFVLTPKIFYMISSVLVVSIFLVFIGFQLYNLLSSPWLSVESPVAIKIRQKFGNQEFVEDIKIDSSEITVSGFTDKDSLVYVNDERVILEDDNSFEQLVNVPVGDSTLVIKSENGFNRETVLKINVENNN